MPTFVILAHNEPAQLARLVRRLQPHPVVLSIDGKVDASCFEAARKGSAALLNDVVVHWGGLSMVRATARAYQAALPLTPPGDYVVLLSGSSYPCRPIDELTSHLATLNGRQLASAYWLAALPTSIQDHMRKSWFNDAYHFGDSRTLAHVGRIMRRAHRTWTGSSTPITNVAFGSQWTALTAEAVTWLLDRMSSESIWARYERSFAPDELLIPTLLAESHFPGTDPTSPTLTTTSWHPVRGGGAFLDGNLHALRTDLREVWTLRNWSAQKTASKFFIRKVSPRDSSDLLQELDSRLDSGKP